jgi:hypothetical protein
MPMPCESSRVQNVDHILQFFHVRRYISLADSLMQINKKSYFAYTDFQKILK